MYKVYNASQHIQDFASKEAATNFINDEAMAGNDTTEYWVDSQDQDEEADWEATPCLCGSGLQWIGCRANSPLCG